MPAEVDESHVLLYRCFDDLNDQKINFHRVAEHYGISSAALRARFTRLKVKIEAHLAKSSATDSTPPTKKTAHLKAASGARKRKLQDVHASSDEEGADVDLKGVGAEKNHHVPISAGRRIRSKQINFKEMGSDDPASGKYEAGYESSDDYEPEEESIGAEEEITSEEDIVASKRRNSEVRKSKAARTTVKAQGAASGRAAPDGKTVKASTKVHTIKTRHVLSSDDGRIEVASVTPPARPNKVQSPREMLKTKSPISMHNQDKALEKNRTISTSSTMDQMRRREQVKHDLASFKPGDKLPLELSSRARSTEKILVADSPSSPDTQEFASSSQESSSSKEGSVTEGITVAEKNPESADDTDEMATERGGMPSNTGPTFGCRNQ